MMTTRINEEKGLKTFEKSTLQVAYVITSNGYDGYSDMAWVSIISLRLSNPRASIILICDSDTKASLSGIKHQILNSCDHIISVPTPDGTPVFRHRWVKTQLCSYLKGQTLFLDADTLVRAPVTELMNQSITIGAALDANGQEPPPHDSAFRNRIRKAMNWPHNKKYYNSGVIAYNFSSDVAAFFDTWHSLWLKGYEQEGCVLDQPSFNAVIEMMQTSFCEIPLRFNYQTSVSWKEASTAVIWHFWGTTANSGHSLAALTRAASNLTNDELTARVGKAISMPTPVATSDLLGRLLSKIRVPAETQRKIQYKRSAFTRHGGHKDSRR